MVLTAVVVIPIRLGGFGHIFAVSADALARHKPAASILLLPPQYLGYSSLALGSALALIFYPHTITGALSSASDKVLRRNAALLPAYNLLLGLVALLGYMAIAAAIHPQNSSGAVPLLLLRMFPAWFSGFCLAAIAIGALVPAAIMSIATANLFTRNLYGELVHRRLHGKAMAPHQEAANAKLVSLVIKFGALAFVLFARAEYAIELQLLGGVWILQLFPSVVCGLFTRFFHGRALLLGWAAGMTGGTAMVASLGFRSSVFPFHFAGRHFAIYAALPALALNLAVAAIGSMWLHSPGEARARSASPLEDEALSL
ncbi:MAG TPA: sodium:solute symporter, partial [Acidobacteriaceae bacterium]|nr:sodium:solute symporter [Acidobacteriaceae bacterium]